VDKENLAANREGERSLAAPALPCPRFEATLPARDNKKGNLGKEDWEAQIANRRFPRHWATWRFILSLPPLCP